MDNRQRLYYSILPFLIVFKIFGLFPARLNLTQKFSARKSFLEVMYGLFLTISISIYTLYRLFFSKAYSSAHFIVIALIYPFIFFTSCTSYLLNARSFSKVMSDIFDYSAMIPHKNFYGVTFCVLLGQIVIVTTAYDLAFNYVFIVVAYGFFFSAVTFGYFFHRWFFLRHYGYFGDSYIYFSYIVYGIIFVNSVTFHLFRSSSFSKLLDDVYSFSELVGNEKFFRLVFWAITGQLLFYFFTFIIYNLFFFLAFPLAFAGYLNLLERLCDSFIGITIALISLQHSNFLLFFYRVFAKLNKDLTHLDSNQIFFRTFSLGGDRSRRAYAPHF